MGCLTFTVENRCGTGLTVNASTEVNGLAVGTQECGGMQVLTDDVNGILVIDILGISKRMSTAAECRNTRVDIGTANRNGSISISAALVCSVGLNRWEYFYVEEGPVIVEDGYIVVQKEDKNRYVNF